MKTKLLSLSIIAFLLLANVFQASSKVLLRLKLLKGTTYEMTMTSTNLIDQEMMGQKMKIDQKMEMVLSYKVLDVLPNKNFLIEYSLLKMKLKMNINGQEMNIDSDSPDNNPNNASLKGLISNKLKLEINPKGQVQRIEGLEEYTKTLAGNQQMSMTMQMFKDENSLKSFIGQSFNYFPEKKIKKGDKWTSSFQIPTLMNMEAKMNFEVASIVKNMLSLNVISDINIDTPVEQSGHKINVKATGNQSGTMNIDTDDGWLRLSDLSQKFDMKMKMKNPQTGEEMEIPMVLNSVTKLTVVKK